MHITKYTDYSLRTLMYLALQPAGELASIADISATFDISRNHLMKIVTDLANLGLINSVRGRGGGISLGLRADQINIGRLMRRIEPNEAIVDCDSGPCLFQEVCVLSQAIEDAKDAFFAELDKYSLADLVKQKASLERVIRMQQLQI